MEQEREVEEFINEELRQNFEELALKETQSREQQLEALLNNIVGWLPASELGGGYGGVYRDGGAYELRLDDEPRRRLMVDVDAFLEEAGMAEIAKRIVDDRARLFKQ